jgi:hypothetical protein
MKTKKKDPRYMGGGNMPKYAYGGKMYKEGGTMLKEMAKDPKMRAQMEAIVGKGS